jgi:hypothetical protein
MRAPLPNPVAYHIFTGQEIPAPDLYSYVLAGQGVIKLAESDQFRAAMVVAPGRIVGLPDYPVGVELRAPRIPATWLHTVLEHARRCGLSGSGGRGEILRVIEQMYHFHWWAESSGPGFAPCGRWRVSIPKQEATAGHVAYRGGNEASIVLDLHSHHEMRAFFSETDDADEQGCRFYGVIGKIYSRPEIRLRLGVYGDWVEVSPLMLFDGLGPFIDPWEDPHETD